jgi:murein DD-endopeptidase MepM/ murein hydrolase activator NlpD
MIRSLLCLSALSYALNAAQDLRLPTENHHLFTNEPERFYMHVDRIFEGQVSKPWQGGSFGLVRNAFRFENEVLLTKFHEGIDIAPIKRDRAGNPLDLITSISAGRVVHINPLAGRSNYGKYVVVEHDWENTAVYSLYAHLAEITCQPGDLVKAGSVIGRMGYTGAGIDRVRAHLHLELGMLMSPRYQDWHDHYARGLNTQGIFNGMNLVGTDVARFFLEHQKNPELRFSDFVTNTPGYFKVTTPITATPDFCKRYPWIVKGSPDKPKSWEITFSATGQPISFSPSTREVKAAIVTSVKASAKPHRYLTRNLITGIGNKATLTPQGQQLVALITDQFPAPSANKSIAPK